MADNPSHGEEGAIAITNADMHIKESDIIMQLQDAGIGFSRVAKKQGSQRAFIFFQTADSLDNAAAAIRMLKSPISQQLYTCDVVSSGPVSGSTVAPPDTVDAIDQLDKHHQSASFPPFKRAAIQASMSILQVVAPYYNDGAADELQAKSRLIRNAVKNQLTKMYRSHRNTGAIPLWAKSNEHTVHLKQPVPVYSPPLLTGYRSKVEFTIGWTESILNLSDGTIQPKNSTSGDTHSQLIIAVGPCIRHGKRITIFGSNKIHEASIFPSIAAKLSAILETVLSEAHASGYLLNDDLSLFTTLAIRCAGNVSAMHFDVTQLLVGVFLRIELPAIDSRQHLENNVNQSPSHRTMDVTSEYDTTLQKAWPLILKFHDRVNNALKNEYHIVLYAKTTTVQKGSPHRDRYYPVTSTITETSPSEFYITQTLYGLKFCIGPETFFQSNLSAFTMLLDYISNIVVTILESSYTNCQENGASPPLLPVELLDICCGSGVIGQCLAQIIFKKMVGCHNLHINIKGIDCSQDAIKNAEFNASENFKDNPNISAAYICSKAERAPEYFSGSAKIGILDPPRTGVLQTVLTAIRQSTLEYLIYVSCNPRTMSQNIIDLSIVSIDADASKHTAPFYVESLVGFNMFPGCEHVETVAILHRCPNLEGALPKKILSSDVGPGYNQPGTIELN